MTPLVAAMLVLAADGDKHLLPFQADLSAVAGLGERSAAGLALYVGVAAGPARPPWGAPFGGLGFEFVQAAGFSPFRASYGLQLRAGYAWSRADSKADSLMPDVLVFVRVTPFIGSSTGVGDGQLPPGFYGPMPDGVLGVRVGIGLTSPWWTSVFLFHRPFGDERGFLGEAMNVFTTLLLAPIGLLNHLELVGELVALTGGSTMTIRFGCGF